MFVARMSADTMMSEVRFEVVDVISGTVRVITRDPGKAVTLAARLTVAAHAGRYARSVSGDMGASRAPIDERPCPRCRGLGELPNHDQCPRCHGSGELDGCWATRFGQSGSHDRKTCGHYQ